MRPTALLALLLLAASFVLPAKAQDTPRTISFDEAISIALEQNVTLRRAQNSLDLQENSVEQARNAFLPNLNASTSTGRNWGLTFDATTLSLVTRSSDRFSYGANASLNIFNGFADVAGLDQARFYLAAQEESLERSEQTVVFTVIQNYLQFILDRENITIRQEDLESLRQQLDRIEEFVRVGTRPVSDLYIQQANVANSEALLLNAERSLQLSESRLINTLQLDPLGTYEFQTPSADDISLLPRSYQANELLRNAFLQRSDLRAQEYVIDAVGQGLKLAKASRLPRLNLSSGIYSSSYSSLASDPLTGMKKNFTDQLRDNRSHSVSLSLSIPIFNRFQTRTNLQRAEVQLSNAQLDLENLEQGIALEVRQAYLDYQTAVKRLDVTEAQVRSAQQALEVERERYDVGASTLVELTQAQATFVNASSQRVQAIYQFHFQHRLIEYYQGTLDPTESLF